MKGRIRTRFISGLLAIVMTLSLVVTDTSFVKAADPAINPESVTVTEAGGSLDVSAGDTITSGGVYAVTEGTQGIITVNTTEPVTFTGRGIDAANAYTGLSVECAAAGADITIDNLAIMSPVDDKSVFDFTGVGNTFTFKGVNLLERTLRQPSGKAMIHVGTGTELTIEGYEESSTLYFYKAEMAAGIGGNTGENNGNITINSGHIFGKGTMKGAVIGQGASTTADAAAGTITINGGVLNLIAVAKGAAIGGSVNSDGSSDGGNVYVNGGSINLNADFAGAAIGDGGYAAGDDFSIGNLYISGGSIRTYIDQNAVPQWNSYGVTAPGVNGAAVTARKLDRDGNDLYLMAFDTSLLQTAAENFEAKIDGRNYYSGGLHSYCYVNEGSNKEVQKTTGTVSNWSANTDSNLYFYATGKDHTVTVNGESFTFSWDEGTKTFHTAMPSVTALTTGGTPEAAAGTIHVSSESPKAGDTVTVTAAPTDGHYLAQVRYADTRNKSEESYVKYTALTKNADGSYSFVMPDTDVTVYADFVSKIWDGTIDLTWYDPAATEYHIQYAAQLAGAAALTNGLFNDYPVSGENLVPNTNEDRTPYGSTEELFNTFQSTSDASTSTTVIGDISNLKAFCSTGTTGANNVVTTNDYWYGTETYKDKTLYLDADINMGGTDVNGSWSGPNYMPVGGQYCLNNNSGYTKLSSSFNGTFDGQGHIVYNIYCYRYTANFGDSQSVGIIGRLGVHDNDPVDTYADVAVRNVASAGYIYSRRSVGGIVGKTGHSNSCLIENCVNFSTVKNTDAKGVGGIVGGGMNAPVIRNCVNFGYIYTSYHNAGGISGYSEAKAYNCYNFGYVGSSSVSEAQAFGTNVSGAAWYNCYWLTGSCVSNQPVYNMIIGTITEIKTPEELLGNDFLAGLNGSGRAWVNGTNRTFVSSVFADCLKNVSSYGAKRAAYDCSGMPVPRVFTTDTATVTSVSESGKCVSEYVSGQTFKPDTLVITAQYSDGTSEPVTDYKITTETGGETLTTRDTYLVLSGNFGGVDYSYKYPVTVTDNELSTIEVTTPPKRTLYGMGETFNPAGMIVTANYTNGKSAEITDYTWAPTGTLSATDSTITICYSYCGKTAITDVTISVMDSAKPFLNEEGYYEICSAAHLIWFAGLVNSGNNTKANARLMTDIDLAGADWAWIGNLESCSYEGNFDGNDKTIHFDGNNGLFCYIGKTGVVHNVITSGKLYDTTALGAIASYSHGTIRDCVNSAVIAVKSCGYAGGFAANVIGGTITNCVNKGAISCLEDKSQYIGGIAGYTRNESEGAVTRGCTITGCVNEGGVTGYYNIGGIIGCEYGLDTVTECVNKGNVLSFNTSGAMYNHGIGGVVGQGNSAGKIERCVNMGRVTSEDYSVGGIIGYVANMSFVVSDCYNRAPISDTAKTVGCNVGGIAGRTQNVNAAVRNCYNTGAVTSAATGTAYNYAASIIGYAAGVTNVSNNYYLAGTAKKGIGNSTDNSVVKESAELMALAASLGSVYKNGNGYTNAGYPVLSWQKLNEDVVPEKLTIITPPSKTMYNEGDTLDTTGMTVEAGMSSGESVTVTTYALSPAVLTPEVKTVRLTYTLNGVSITAALNVKVLSANSPKRNSDGAYILETVNDLNWFSAQIANGICNLDAELAADIDISGANWAPMGSDENPYAGNFSGKGHSVTLSCNGKQYLGLFDYTNRAVISDLTIKGEVTSSKAPEAYTGAVAGRAVSTTIANCVNEAVITSGGNHTAGIVGYADGCVIHDCRNTGSVIILNNDAEAIAGITGYTKNGTTVTSCANLADVTGGSKTGGIVGDAFGGEKISQCYNTGTITGSNNGDKTVGTGGIAGNIKTSGSISECYNEGVITGDIANLGGILGYTSNAAASVMNCYNSGDVRGTSALTTSAAGGIAGKSFTVMTLQNCYNRGTVTLNNEGTYTAGKTGFIGAVAGYIGSTSKESNNYYLKGSAGSGLAYPAKDNTIAEDETSLKAAAKLGASFKDSDIYTNAGYPVLTWQKLYDAATLMKLEVTTGPSKTAYTENEVFNKEGMVVTALYSDGTSKEVMDYTYSPSGKLLPDNDAVFISYTDHNVTKTARQAITVTALSKDSSLSSLSFAPGRFDETFSPDNHVYSATVGNGALKTQITASSADPEAEITIKQNALTPEKLANGASTIASLDLGANVFTITVTARNGRDKTDYVVTVTREYSSVATLSAMTISAGTLSPEFDEGVKEYTAKVSSDTDHVDLMAVAKDDTIASMTVRKDNDEPKSINSGETTSLGLEPGDNVFRVETTAQNKVNKETYIITITREQSAPEKVSRLSYQTHIENIGWQDKVSNGALSGTTGQALRLEAFKIALEDQTYTGDIEYSAHVENIGWQDSVANGEISGTTGQALRVEALRVSLTGEMAKHYDIYYRAHAQNYGWLNWASNGAPAGTSGYALRLEALEIVLVEKGQEAPVSDGDNVKAYIHPMIGYTAHVENVGWQDYVTDGEISGTSGQSLRLEAIRIELENQDFAGNIEYSAHVQNEGWQTPVSNGALSGTSGQSLRLEAIKINLTGEMAKRYDVYYSVHAQNIGWMGWASNGEEAGTAGMALRLEAIKIVLVEKDQDAPGSVEDAFRQAVN